MGRTRFCCVWDRPIPVQNLVDMARIYNQIGSLTQLSENLKENGIDGFETMDDIRAFRNGYKNSLLEIEEKNGRILKQEIIDLELKYKELSSKLDTDLKERENLLKGELIGLKKRLSEIEIEESEGLLKKTFFFFKRRKMLTRKRILESSFQEELKNPFKRRFEAVECLRSEIGDKKNNPEKWIKEYSSGEIRKQESILSVFKEHRFLFYGAEGEEQAERELSKLPDTYVVINDYRLRFQPPIYNKKDDDRIYSVQIDHIVVGPTGIYLIETKNWSKNSLESKDLFSPVKQLRRHNYAIFVLLNKAVGEGELAGFSGHWGERKISPKNIILLTGHKPQEEYQYVKILSVSEIVRYISYKGRQPMFSGEELKSLVDYLIYLSESRAEFRWH